MDQHNISRRSLVAGLGAAIPAATVAAVPALAGTDPILAAIEAHRKADAEDDAAHDARDAAEWAFPDGWGADPELRAKWDADPVVQAAVDRAMAAMAAEESAFRALLATKPATEAGWIALARYGCDLDLEGNVPCTGAPRPFRVLAALAGIAEQNAQMDDEGDAA